MADFPPEMEKCLSISREIPPPFPRWNVLFTVPHRPVKVDSPGLSLRLFYTKRRGKLEQGFCGVFALLIRMFTVVKTTGHNIPTFSSKTVSLSVTFSLSSVAGTSLPY